MKNLLLLFAVVMLITGCTSEFYKHDSLFKTNQHAAYSGWRKEIPYVPAK